MTSDYGFGDKSHTGEHLNRGDASGTGQQGGIVDKAKAAVGGSSSTSTTTTGSSLAGAADAPGFTNHISDNTSTGLNDGHHSGSHHGAGLTGAAAGAGAGTGAGLAGNSSHTTTNPLSSTTGTTQSGTLSGSDHEHSENCSHGHPAGTAGHGRMAQTVQNTADKLKGDWEGFHRADGRRFECDAFDESQLADRTQVGAKQSSLERV